VKPLYIRLAPQRERVRARDRGALSARSSDAPCHTRSSSSTLLIYQIRLWRDKNSLWSRSIRGLVNVEGIQYRWFIKLRTGSPNPPSLKAKHCRIYKKLYAFFWMLFCKYFLYDFCSRILLLKILQTSSPAPRQPQITFLGVRRASERGRGWVTGSGNKNT
jgi:hypothetical protein